MNIDLTNLLLPAITALFGIFALFVLIGALKRFGIFSRVSKISLSMLVLLGISPVGAIVPFMLLNINGVCGGALGSGVYCNVPIIGAYLVLVAQLTEMSLLLLFGLIWIPIAFAIWVMIVLRILTLLFLKLRP